MHQPHIPPHPTPATGPSTRVQDRRVLCHYTFEPTAAEAARRCGSPALRGETFCFYHHPTRKAALNRDLTTRRERQLARKRLPFPLPTTRAEHHHALLYLTHLIAANEIDTRRAGLLLHALQTASKHL